MEIGRSSLVFAVGNYHNGMNAVRERFGLSSLQRPTGYWQQWENVEQELQAIMQQLGHFPTLTELKNLGKSSLGFALGNYHGGINAIRKVLGKESGVKPPGYWQDWTNTKQELKNTIQLLGHFPTQQELTTLRRSSLAMAMKYHGGVKKVCLRLQQEGVLPSEQDQLEQLVEQYIA